MLTRASAQLSLFILLLHSIEVSEMWRKMRMTKVVLAASAEVMIIKFVWAVAMDPKLVRNGVAQ